MMTFKQYQTTSARTAPTGLSDADRRENAGMMIVGEFGEWLDIVKKHKFQGHPLDRDALRNEFGDVFWGLAECATVLGCPLEARPRPTSGTTPINVACGVAFLALGLQTGTAKPADVYYVVGDLVHLIEEYGFTLDEVLTANVAKLARRYPDGFSVEASINRGAS